MRIELLVFGGDQCIAQHLRKIFIVRHHPALQREGPDHHPMIVINFRDRTGPVGFQRIHLRQVGGVDQQQSGRSPHQHGDQHQQAEQNAAHKPAPPDLHLGEVFVKSSHAWMSSG